MAKNNKKDSKEPEIELTSIPSVTIGSNNTKIPFRNNLIGEVISLNQKEEFFFRVGPIRLDHKEYCAVVPDGLTDEEYSILQRSLAAGTIVIGNQIIPAVEKPGSVLDEYWLELRDSNGFNNNPKIKAKFTKLVRNREDRGWTAYEIIEYCMNNELKTKKRIDVVRLLKEVIDNYEGPITKYTPPDRMTDVQKVIIKDGQITKFTADGKSETSYLGVPDANKVEIKTTPAAKAALDQLF